MSSRGNAGAVSASDKNDCDWLDAPALKGHSRIKGRYIWFTLAAVRQIRRLGLLPDHLPRLCRLLVEIVVAPTIPTQTGRRLVAVLLSIYSSEGFDSNLRRLAYLAAYSLCCETENGQELAEYLIMS